LKKVITPTSSARNTLNLNQNSNSKRIDFTDSIRRTVEFSIETKIETAQEKDTDETIDEGIVP